MRMSMRVRIQVLMRAGCWTTRPRSRVAALALALGSAALIVPSVAATEPRPLDAVFVIDNSGSMKTNDPGFVTRRVVTDFAERLSSESRLGIVLFDEEARLIEPLSPANGTQSAARWTANVASIDYRGLLTDSPAGIERAIYELKSRGRAEADKLIVFITDGIIDTGDRQRDVERKRWLTGDLASEGERAGVRIFGIALSEEADVELIQALALATQGEYFRVYRASDIPGILTRIGEIVATPHRREHSPPSGRAGGGASAPVSSAPAARTFDAVWLSFGLLAILLVVAAPLLLRRYRREGAASQRHAESLGPEPAPPLRSSPNQPGARLVDVANASVNGLLPISLDKQRLSIGRDGSNDVVIRRETISSFHATIDFVDGYFRLEDHRSTNGTYLNGEELRESQPVQLKSGDRVDFSDFEFRFIIPDHELRGRTVALDGSSLPAPPSSTTGEWPEEGALSKAAPPDYAAAFDECLAAHLQKMRLLGQEHREFVNDYLSSEMTSVLSQRARELVERCQEVESGQVAQLSKSGIHYALCVLPARMGDAAVWFKQEHGGYAKFLVELLGSWASAGRECRALCVITYGVVGDPWISVTVVPAREDSEAIEVMSFEFLSEEERRRALSLDIVDVGRAD